MARAFREPAGGRRLHACACKLLSPHTHSYIYICICCWAHFRFTSSVSGLSTSGPSTCRKLSNGKGLPQYCMSKQAIVYWKAWHTYRPRVREISLARTRNREMGPRELPCVGNLIPCTYLVRTWDKVSGLTHAVHAARPRWLPHCKGSCCDTVMCPLRGRAFRACPPLRILTWHVTRGKARDVHVKLDADHQRYVRRPHTGASPYLAVPPLQRLQVRVVLRGT